MSILDMPATLLVQITGFRLTNICTSRLQIYPRKKSWYYAATDMLGIVFLLVAKRRQRDRYDKQILMA